MVELIVAKGALVPADDRARAELRKMKLGIGEIVQAKIQQPRNVRFFRLAHKLGALVRQNIEGFEYLSDHEAIKRLQYETGVECKMMQMRVPGAGMVDVRIPNSLKFEDMDEARFHDLMTAICRHLSAEYWPDCTPEQIERMAEAMVDET